MTSTSLTVTTPNKEAPATPLELVAKAHPAVAHALKAATLQTSWAARSISNASATAQIFALGIDSETWSELLQMQQAAWRRLLTMQMNWTSDWKSWIQYSEQIKGANTMSKLAERESNIGAQLTQLLSNQFTDLVGLQENIDVDYSYWINEKLNEKRKSHAEAAVPK